MTRAYNARPPNPSHPARGTDTYDNIEPWLEQLATLRPDDPDRAKLREEIIGRCLPLGEHIARRYTGRGVDFDDLSQIAAVGVILAVDRFDHTTGATFLGFAVPTVLGEVRRYFRDRTWAVQVPRRTKELQQRLIRVIPEMMQELGHAPTARELAVRLDADAAEVTQALIANNCYRSDSLDQTLDNSDADNPASPVQQLAVEEPGYNLIEETLTAAPLLAELSDKERDILTMRYGGNLTQAAIAERIGVSQMQVSRILSRVLATLQEQALQPAPA